MPVIPSAEPGIDSQKPVWVKPLKRGSVVLYDVTANSIYTKKYKNGVEVPLYGTLVPPTPPSPPNVIPPSPPLLGISAPASPLEVAREIAKTGGVFLLNGKTVNSAMAISVLKDKNLEKEVSIIDKLTGSEMTIRTK